MSDLSDREKRHVLAMDATLAMATMASMARFIHQAKGPRDIELITRAVVGFMATCVLSLKASSDKSIPDEDYEARQAALRAYLDAHLGPMIAEIFAEELPRVAKPKSERDRAIASVEASMVEVKH